MTVDWYRVYYENKSANMYQLTIRQISEFIAISRRKYTPDNEAVNKFIAK
jgi:hypothetical protein